MTHLRKVTSVSALILGLAACETTEPLDFNQDRIERGKAAIAECAASLCGRLDLDGALVEDFTVLADMSHVKILMVSYTNLSDLSEIAGMSQLEELHMGATEVSDLSGLAAFPNLSLLHAQDLHDVSSYAPVAGLRGLQELAIGTYDFNQVAVVAALPQLKRLIMRLDFEADLTPLAGHASLEMVDLGDSSIEDISVLLTLPRLREAGVPAYWEGSLIEDDANALIARGVTVRQQEIIPVC